jgi:hypothetical protein
VAAPLNPKTTKKVTSSAEVGVAQPAAHTATVPTTTAPATAPTTTTVAQKDSNKSPNVATVATVAPTTSSSIASGTGAYMITEQVASMDTTNKVSIQIMIYVYIHTHVHSIVVSSQMLMMRPV